MSHRVPITLREGFGSLGEDSRPPRDIGMLIVLCLSHWRYRLATWTFPAHEITMLEADAKGRR